MARQIFEHHPILGYRFVPGLKARVPQGPGYLIRTNNLGFRCDHDVTPAARSTLRRMLLFGDSFTAGDFVSNGQRFGDLVERKVADLQVDNFGLPGSGTDQHYLIWKEYAPDLSPDLVVIAVLVENIRRVVAHYRYYENATGAKVVYAKPYYALEGDRLVLKGVPVPRQPIPETELPEEERAAVDRGGRFEKLREVVNQLGLREVAQRVTRYQPVPEYDDAHHPAWLLMRAILAQWIEDISTPVLLVPIPLYQFVEGTSDPASYQQRFDDLARDTGARLHDPLPDLMRLPPATRRGFRFAHDPHLTPAGHEALADSLIPAVEQAIGPRRTETVQ